MLMTTHSGARPERIYFLRYIFSETFRCLADGRKPPMGPASNSDIAAIGKKVRRVSGWPFRPTRTGILVMAY